MSAIKVKTTQFSGLSHIFNRSPGGLSSIVRGMLIDNARLKVEVSGVKAFTDNSTGTASSIVKLHVGPTGAIDGTSAGGCSYSALNTSLGKIANAGKVITGTINEASALLGLPANSAASGTQAAADTIPAQDVAGATATGTTCATYASAVASMKVAAANMNALINGMNAVLVAVGAAPLPNCGVFGAPGNLAAIAIPAAVAVAAGPGAVAKADVTAFLLAYTNNIATIAAAWNAALNQGSPGAGALHVVAG